jgi:hypothetical protein
MKRWASNEGPGQYDSEVSHCAELFLCRCSSCWHSVKLAHPYPMAPEHTHHRQALAFWRATAVTWGPWIQHKGLKCLYPEPIFWVLMQNYFRCCYKCFIYRIYSFLKIFVYLFLIFGCTGSLLLRGLSLVMVIRRSSVHCGARAIGRVGSVVVAHGLSCSKHVESSQTRDWTSVPCVGRQLTTGPPGKSYRCVLKANMKLYVPYTQFVW